MYLSYSGISWVSSSTVSQDTWVLLRTRRRTREKASAHRGSRVIPASGLELRLRNSRLGMLETILLIWKQEIMWCWEKVFKCLSLKVTDHRTKHNLHRLLYLLYLSINCRGIKQQTQKQHLMPVLQFVMGQVQLHNVGTEGSNFSLVSCPADSTAVQHQDTGQVQTVWGEDGKGWKEEFIRMTEGKVHTEKGGFFQLGFD